MRTSLSVALFIAAFIASGSNSASAGCKQPLSFLGGPAPAQSAVDEVIVITDATRYVNVTGGTTVKFVVGNRSFNWSFQIGGAHIIPFDLQRIAPRGLLNHPVTAYVDDDPLYLG